MYQSVSIVEESIEQEAEIARNKQKKMKLAEFKVKRKVAGAWPGKSTK